jgi:hypothetical protein
MSNIQKLEQTLAQRLTELEIQREAENAEFERKKAERERAIADAKEKQRVEYEAKLAATLARQQEERDRYTAWEREEKARREEIDRENLRVEQERREEAEKVKALQDKLTQIEYAEEQRRKAREAALPVFVDQGVPVDGIHGLEPETNSMSDHLKRLLRQDRDFNV